MSCDWDWYYPYDYSPTLRDISLYLEDNNITQTIKLSTAEPKPLTPLELLTVVLPIRNKELMPVNLFKHMNKYADLFFPTEYELNTMLNTYYYECSPIIPKVNINMVRKFSSGCKLLAHETKLCSKGEIFTMNS